MAMQPVELDCSLQTTFNLALDSSAQLPTISIQVTHMLIDLSNSFDCGLDLDMSLESCVNAAIPECKPVELTAIYALGVFQWSELELSMLPDIVLGMQVELAATLVGQLTRKLTEQLKQDAKRYAKQ